MADIDKLQIEIEASSTQAEAQINALNDQLKALKSTLGGQWKNPIKDIQRGTRAGASRQQTQKEPPKAQVSGTTQQDSQTGEAEDAAQRVNRLRESFEKLRDSIMQANSAWKDMRTAGAEAAEDIRAKFVQVKQTIQFSSMAKSIKDTFASAGDYAKRQAESIVAAFNPLKDKITKPISHAVEKGKTLIGTLAEGIKETLSVTGTAFGSGMKYFGATIAQPVIGAVQGIGKAFEKISPIASRVGSAIGTAFSGVKGVLGTVASGVGSVAKSFGGTLLNGIQKAASGIGNFAEQMGGALVSGVKKSVGAVANFSKNIVIMPFKAVGSRVSGFVKSLTGLAASFKRIMLYRAVRTVIKEIGEAFSEGTKNVYQWSKAVGGSFAASMDSAASSMAYLKNSIGAAVSPILTALVPALETAVNWVVALINALNQLFAALGGSGTFTKAVKGEKEFSAAAGGAAKEMQKFLLPFDEINKIPDQSGGGGAGGAIQDMFEEAAIDSQISDFASQLREAFEKQDWKGIGEILGNKVNEIIDNVPWETLGSKFGDALNGIFSTEYFTLKTINFENIGQNVATLINNALEEINGDTAGRLVTRKITVLLDLAIGFIEGIDADTIGKFVGDFLDGAISEAQEWLTEKPWEDIGKKIGEIAQSVFSNINNVLDGHEFGTLGTSLAELINGVLESDLDFTTVGETIIKALGIPLDNVVKFVETLHWDELGQAFGNLINGAISEARNWLSEQNFGDLAEKIFTGVNEAVKTIQWDEIGGLLSDAAKGFLDFIISGLETIEWKQIGESVKEFISGVDWTGLAERLAEGIGAALGSLAALLWGLIEEAWNNVVQWWEDVAFEDGQFTIEGLLNGIVEAVKNIGAWIKEHIFQPFIDGFKKAFGIASPSTVMDEQGNFIIEGLLQGISNTWHTITDFFDGVIEPLKTFFEESWINISEKASEIWGGIKGFFEETWNGLKDTATEVWGNVKTFVSETWDNLKTNASSVWGDIKTTVSDAYNTAKDNVTDATDAIWEKVSGVWGDLKTTAKDTWDNVKDSITGGIETARDKVKGAIDAIKGFFNFEFQWPSLSLPHFSIEPSGWQIGDLLKGEIPKLGIQWYARGGIVDGATLIGAGEAGKEAIVPLERNTQWIDRVSEGLADRLGANNGGVSDADAIAEMAEMIVNAIYASGNQTVRAIEDKDTSTHLDGASFARGLYPYMRQAQNQRGGSLVNVNG